MNQLIQIVIGGLLQGSVFAVVALGFSLVYPRHRRHQPVARRVLRRRRADDVHAAGRFRLAVPVAFVGAVLGTGLYGAVLGAATFVPAVSRLPQSSLFVMTGGILTLTEGLLLVVWGSQPYALPPFSGEAPVQIVGIRVPTQGFWIAGATVAIIVTLWYLLTRTTAGMALGPAPRTGWQGASWASTCRA